MNETAHLQDRTQLPLRRLEPPMVGGPWSFRFFETRPAAFAFYGRIGPERVQPPVQLGEDRIAPDHMVVPAGTWIVLYRPIIQDG